MVRQQFSIDGYYEVIVYYDVDYNFFDGIALELRKIGFTEAAVEGIYDKMAEGDAKAVTCSKPGGHISVVLFNKHSSRTDYINSIVHEAEHVKQAVLEAYSVRDKGEAPAYTVGYIVGKMYRVFRHILSNV